MLGAIPPFPQYALIARCSVKKKHSDNFNFTFTFTCFFNYANRYFDTRFEVYKSVKVQVEIFCVVTPCNVVVGYQRFGGPYWLHLHATRRHNPKDLGFETIFECVIYLFFLFTTASRTALGLSQPPIQRVLGALSLGVKRPGHEADHSLPASAEVKE
jgi:hypothetical protein